MAKGRLRRRLRRFDQSLAELPDHALTDRVQIPTTLVSPARRITVRVVYALSALFAAVIIVTGFLPLVENMIGPDAIRVGDVLTFAHHGRVRVLRVEALPSRRGPAPEAQACYQELTPGASPPPASPPLANVSQQPHER